MIGLLDAGLERDERRHQHGGERAHAEHVRRRPAVGGRLDDRVDRAHQRGGDEQRAEPVHPVLEPEPAVGAHDRAAERERRDADREVDEEHPVPAQRLGEQAAGEQAERAAGDRDEHVRAHRPGALRGLRELGDDDRQDHRRLGGGADALQQAGGDQRALASGRCRTAATRRVKTTRPARNTRLRPMRSPRRPARSSRLPKVTRKALTTHVRFAWLKPRSLLDRGQRDVHDRHVEDDHQLREADDDQRGPAAAIVGRAGSGCGCELQNRTPLLSRAGVPAKMEGASEITGGCLRNYTEGASVCQPELS